MLRLREARKRNGYTMKELGAIVGITEGAVSNYENGKRQPDLDMLIKLADALGCSTDYLLGRVDLPDEHFIAKEKLPAELAGSGFGDVTKVGSPALTEQEIEVLKRLAAQFGQQD